MLRLLFLSAQAVLIALAAYNAVTALWGWRERPRASSGKPLRLRVVVPAHDEAAVISGVLSDLESSTYDAQLVDVWVLADRCSDDTAALARALAVNVAERKTGTGGKGAAVSWFLDSHPLGTNDALVVFDADNRVPPHALGRIADELSSAETVVQCYLDVANPDESLLTEASALSYWAGNRMVQLARENLGWSADLGGTGMALTKTALDDAGGFGASLTEDQDLGVRLLLSGHRVAWLHDVRVLDEKPKAVRVAVRQRARWMAGKRGVRRAHLGKLLSRPTPDRVDMALRLLQPGRSFQALISGLLTAIAAVTGSVLLFPWQIWAVVTAVQVLEPIPFLAKEGVGASRLARYPLLALLAALWVPIRVVSGRVNNWYHTPHQGITSDGATPARRRDR